jgi:nitrogen fixation/metabolism regulation signal transduction histidine kinase
MIPNLLKILFFLLPLCALLLAGIGWMETSSPVRWIFASLFGIILLCWTYLSVRLFSFRKRLFNFLRLLVAGDYEAGMRTRQRFTDEISTLEDLSNQLTERLRTYDRLRADRVSIHARVLELLLIHSKEGLITADIEKELLVFNPVAQKLLGVRRKSFSFESVLKAEVNSSFSKLFAQATTGRKTNTKGGCFLQLPGMQAPVKLTFLIMPLRDRDETVRFALISIE